MRLRDDDEIRRLAIAILKTSTKRDKQVSIGGSEIGNPCDYCLSRRLAMKTTHYEIEPVKSPYWLGSKLSTYNHLGAEEDVRTRQERGEIIELQGALMEQRVEIGELEGYGTIGSRFDLLLPTGNLMDWKFSKKDYIERFKAYGVSQQYRVQQHSYCYAINKHLGHDFVRRWTLVYVSKDGSQDKDIWTKTENYDIQVFQDAWSRLEELWEYVRYGNDLEALKSDPDCFVCKILTKRLDMAEG